MEDADLDDDLPTVTLFILLFRVSQSSRLSAPACGMFMYVLLAFDIRMMNGENDIRHKDT